ncbi:MAG: hypothetical protein KAX65_07380 [Caldilineaceae bacterium]|nr:hypothetical protein [Caldilineaceae bacterium]
MNDTITTTADREAAVAEAMHVQAAIPSPLWTENARPGGIIAELRAQLAAATARAEAAETDRDGLRAAGRALARQNKVLERENQELRQKIAEMEVDLRYSRDHVRELTQALEDSLPAREASNKLNEQLLDEAAVAAQDLAAATARAEAAEAKLAAVPVESFYRIVDAARMHGEPLVFDMDTAQKWLAAEQNEVQP